MKTLKIFFLLFVYMTIIYSQNYSPNINWSMHLISDKKNGYDYQSHASAQQVWLDLNNQGYLHAVFIYSAVADNAWADRTSLYFGSIDGGVSWFEVGAVPVNNGMSGRSGFPCIVGTSDGRAVISNHNNNATHPTRSTIFIDESAFGNNFTEYDPGETTTGQPGYPKLAVFPDNDVMIAAFSSDLYLNKLSGGIFTGWGLAGGGDPETYSLAVSENGNKFGLVCLGESLLGQANWVFYNESTDGGLTWPSPTIVWQAYTDSVTGNILGCFRGVNLIFNGEEPCVVFEVGWNNDVGYYPELPSQIRFWSPNINQGSSIIIADSNNVPFYRNYGIFDAQYPLSRPVIGRAQVDDYLFVAFNATSGDYWPGSSSADSTAYMCGMFMYSSDAGNTWSYPERFTPITSPLTDWRYVSIVPVSPVYDNYIQVHLVMQGDHKPGSNINGWNNPPWVGAQYYHFSNEPLVINVKDEQSFVSSFRLEQNFPNPFNPSTKIRFVIPNEVRNLKDFSSQAPRNDNSLVTLKVYDILGNEIATLVDEYRPAGEYEVEFNTSSGSSFRLARNLTSGIYFYTLRAGSFIETKKMILMK